MEYFVTIWCPDCGGYDYDPYGCFDGGSETYGPFKTEDEAKQFAENEIKDTIWEYEIKSD